MKLQLNNMGAWKQVIHFYSQDILKVQACVERLGKIDEQAGGQTKWRILADNDGVHEYWSAERGWWKPESRV